MHCTTPAYNFLSTNHSFTRMQMPVRYLAPLVEVAADHGLRDRSGNAAYIYARALALCRRRVLLAAAAAAAIVRVEATRAHIAQPGHHTVPQVRPCTQLGSSALSAAHLLNTTSRTAAFESSICCYRLRERSLAGE